MRNFSLIVLTLLMCSCGIYQAAKNHDATQGYSYIGLNPVSAITGTSDTTSENFTSFSTYTELIRDRNEGPMTSARAQEILTAMDVVFRDKKVKKMSESQIENLIGPPDKKIISSGSNVDIYQIKGTSKERWLIRD